MSSAHRSQDYSPDKFTVPEINEIIVPALSVEAQHSLSPHTATTNSNEDYNNSSHSIDEDYRNMSIQLENLRKDLNDIDLATFTNFQKFADAVKSLEDLRANTRSHASRVELKNRLQSTICEISNTVIQLKLQISKLPTIISEASKFERVLDDTGFDDHGVIEELPDLQNFRHIYDGLCPTTKSCLLCFALIPKNEVVKKRFLVFWWVGEEYIKLDGGEKTYEEMGDEIFEELVKTGCVEVVNKKYGKVADSYKMNPSTHSAVIEFAKKDGFFDFYENGNPTAAYYTCYKACLVLNDPSQMFLTTDISRLKQEYDSYQKKFSLLKQKHPELILNDSSQKKFSLLEYPELKLKYPELKLNDSSLKMFCLLEQEYPELKLKYPELKRKYQELKPKYQELKWKYPEMKFNDFFLKMFWLLEQEHPELKLKLNFPETLKLTELPEKLQTIFNVSESILDFPKLELFSKFKNVKVLYLGRWENSAKHHVEVKSIEFLKGLRSMKFLRFFSLRGIMNIRGLPDSVCKLSSLIILDLRDCLDLEVLPDGIGSLKNLTHLDISECNFLDYMPKGIALLSELVVLKGFAVSEHISADSCTVGDLSGLRKLRKLSIYTKIKTFPTDAEVKSLQRFEKLQKLRILWIVLARTHEDQHPAGRSCLRAGTKPHFTPKLLKEAKFWHRPRPEIPEAFKELEKLDLQFYPHVSAPSWLIPDKLAKLKKLYIRGGELQNLGQFKENNRWKVEILRLKFLSNLVMYWDELQASFPDLVYFEKCECPKLLQFPCDENGLWLKS